MKLIISICFFILISISASASCGLEGSIEERVRDCSLTKDYFSLVTRTENEKEVWKDMGTGLIWGDRLPNEMSHFNAESVCNDQLAEVGGIKGSWRLPTQEEFEEAEKNGLRSSLPNMNYWFWSSSVHIRTFYYAWLFFGDVYGGTGNYVYRYDNFSVRCVAR